MAKITLRSYEELLVPEEKAQALSALIEERRDDPLGLNAWPITIEHEDGLWVGTLAHIGQISMSEKQKVHKHNFKTEEDITRFHNGYGYGKFESLYQKGYGLVDVKTQFLISTGLASIQGDTLKMLNSPHKEKWMDLWSIYEEHLDPFNELS